MLRRKNTAINSNMFHDNQHTLDYHELSHVGLPILLVAEISLSNSLLIHEENTKENHKRIAS